MIAAFTHSRGIFLAASFLFTYSVSAATIINGGSLTTTTWTPAGNPYIVMGDVTVLPVATLTIEAGVEVRCASIDAQGAGRNASRVELTINGMLDVNGTAASPVAFKGQTASAGSWYGIIISSSGRATLDHASVQHGIMGLVCEAGAGVEANNLTASTNQTAISVSAGPIVLNELHAFANETAINISGTGSSVSAMRSVIYGNTAHGFQINPSGFSWVTIDHCTMHGNGTYGVNIGSASRANVTIQNTIVTGNAYGVYRAVSPNGSVSLSYSDVWGNASNLVNVVGGAGMISADPLYVDANGADNLLGTADDNLRLQPNTPCAYRSDTGQDIGAYENAKLVIFRPELIEDDVRFRVLSISNRMHQLQFTEDFSGWTSVASNRPSATGSIYLTNFGVRSLPKRFYRVRLDD